MPAERGHPARLIPVSVAVRVLAATLAAATLVLVGGVGSAQARTGDGRFSHPTRIDAHFFPLLPGTQFVYDGTVVDETGSHRHRVVFTVTDVVKMINGVLTRAVWDQDINDGVLTEAELALFAQDDNGNVWTMGEYPEEYENGSFAGAPSTWLSGTARARGGILVPGRPTAGSPRFTQGRAPAVQFWDVARVLATGVAVHVTAGCFRGAALIDEWGPLAPEAGHQQKYYAPGVGLVDILANSGTSREDLQLTTINHLDAAGLASAARHALSLDRRAYRNVPAVFRTSAPAYREH